MKIAIIGGGFTGLTAAYELVKEVVGDMFPIEVLKELGGKEVGKGSIMVPIENEAIIVSFFDGWNVVFKRQRILLFS